VTPGGRDRRSREAGYALVGLMAGVAIMLIMMAVATPGWKYVVKNDREEELLFRGGEIADAIQRYQGKNANAFPPTMEALVKGKFLRKAYKDPMTRDGKWRFLKPGEVAAVGGGNLPPGGALPPGARPPQSGPGGGGLGSPPGGPGGNQPPGGSSPISPGSMSPTGQPLGQTIQGVASRSTDKSLRIFNGRDRYDEWLIVPGQQRVIGRPMGPALPGILPATPRPGLSTPAPPPARTP
jgi:type II secretory pathway pseudopilin PulG